MFNNIRITFDVTKEKLRLTGRNNLRGTFYCFDRAEQGYEKLRNKDMRNCGTRIWETAEQGYEKFSDVTF